MADGSAAVSDAGTPAAQHSGLLHDGAAAGALPTAASATASDGLLAKLQARLTAVRMARSRDNSRPGSPRGGDESCAGQQQQHQQHGAQQHGQQQQQSGEPAGKWKQAIIGGRQLHVDPADPPHPADLATAIRLAAAHRQADRLFGVPIHGLPHHAAALQTARSADDAMDGAADSGSSDGGDGDDKAILLQPPPVSWLLIGIA